MNSALTAIIQHIYTLTPEVLHEVEACFQPMEYPKNYYLLKQGRPCRHLWFMVKGVARYLHTTNDGKDTNVWFSIDQDIITDTPHFVHQTPATSSIQLLEDSELYAIEHSQIKGLLQKHHLFALWYIAMVEKYYVTQVEDRINDLQFLTAKQRYLKLLRNFPTIGNRINLGHIATYLNITQETLSRIRAGKM